MGKGPGNVIADRGCFGRARKASADVQCQHHRFPCGAKALNRYDLALARRVLGAGVLLGASAFAIGAATDEATSSTADRLGRVAALLPVLGALAAALVVAQARSRGEMRALHALGVGPTRALRGAWVGAVLVGLIGVGLVASGVASVGSLFPRIDAVAAWAFVDGLWVEERALLAVNQRGEVLPWPSSLPSAPTPPSFEPATIFTIALSSLVMPAWALASSSNSRRLVVALAAALAAITLFHLVAAERLPPMALGAWPLLFLIDLRLRGTPRPGGA